ncbi:glycosyltransferase, partial [bacterium]|nr:glycosyltransferase [bacterium]
NILNPLHEAMTAGLPVIALDTGRTSTVVRDDETGVLLRADALSTLGVVLTGLLREEGRRRRLGKAAAADAESRLPTLDERQRMEVEAVERVVERRQADVPGDQGSGTHR